jgi:hypothetical protein
MSAAWRGSAYPQFVALPWNSNTYTVILTWSFLCGTSKRREGKSFCNNTALDYSTIFLATSVAFFSFCSGFPSYWRSLPRVEAWQTHHLTYVLHHWTQEQHPLNHWLLHTTRTAKTENGDSYWSTSTASLGAKHLSTLSLSMCT